MGCREITTCWTVAIPDPYNHGLLCNFGYKISSVYLLFLPFDNYSPLKEQLYMIALPGIVGESRTNTQHSHMEP